MVESKSTALPLGYAPSRKRADHTDGRRAWQLWRRRLLSAAFWNREAAMAAGTSFGAFPLMAATLAPAPGPTIRGRNRTMANTTNTTSGGGNGGLYFIVGAITVAVILIIAILTGAI